MKRAFTLVELLVVVGIMAMLGIAATGGYAALQRGMAERGAVAAMNAFLKSAKERALIDRVPTAVYCYNRMLRKADDDNAAVVVGEAVAVRRAGRISRVLGKYLIDEFADLSRTYDVESDESALDSHGGIRLWHFDDPTSGGMQYSIIADAVIRNNKTKVSMYSFENTAEGRTATYYAEAAAFYTRSGGNFSQWKSGTGYGFEFATIQLPNNFIFGDGSIPSDVSRIEEVKPTIYFDPEAINDQKIEIYSCRPSAGGSPVKDRKAGQASSKRDATS